MPLRPLSCLVLVAAAASAPAFAQSVRPSLSFSGFGTLGYAALDEEGAEYRSGVARDGADADGSFALDSRLGLQADARFTRRLSSTVQVTVREGAEGEPEAALEWGLLRFLVTDSIGVRVGRMSLPVFALSDFREVGYANALLRPPEDVYTQIPLRRFDGVDVTFDTEAWRTLLRTQLFAGSSRERIYDSLEPDAKDSLGIAFAAERGPFRLRLSHVSSRLGIESSSGDIAELHAGILRATPLVPALGDIADDFAPERRSLTFDAIGASYDPGGWFVDLEYARRRVDSWVSNIDSVSVSAGLRVASFTPYAFASTLDEVDGDRRVELPDDPRLVPIEEGINALYEPRDQRTVGAGLRVDVRPDIALKGQVERISRDVTGVSFLRREVDDGSDAGDDVTLFSAAIDVVF